MRGFAPAVHFESSREVLRVRSPDRSLPQRHSVNTRVTTLRRNAGVAMLLLTVGACAHGVHPAPPPQTPPPQTPPPAVPPETPATPTPAPPAAATQPPATSVAPLRF